MLSARILILPLAIFAPLSAFGTDLIRESFDTKTPGTALDGQSVELSLEPRNWGVFTDPSSATPNWTISSAISFAGANSVRVDSGGEITSSMEASTSVTYPVYDPSRPTYRVSGALNVATGGSNVGYGIGAMAEKFLGGLYILGTGEVVVLGGGGGHLAYSAPGVPLVASLDAWHSLEAVFSYTDEHTANASFYFDGSRVSFDGTTFGSYSVTTSKQPRSIYMESASADGSGPAFGTAHFDSLKLEAVPEPGTLAALCLGLAAVARRRRERP